MKMIEDIRRENLAALRKAAGGLKALAALLGRDESQVSQWINGSLNSSTGKPRGMRSATAREIEKACGKYPGWLDQDHNEGGLLLSSNMQGSETVSVLPNALGSAECLAIPVFDVSASMGLGRPRPDQETVIDHMRMSKEWVRTHLPIVSSPSNLSVLSAYGDSMSPTFSDGDILLVDRGVSDIKIDAVYVLALNDELYIKRIQRRITDGAVMILSDNPAYQPVVVENGHRDSLQVLGRVVWAWNGRKL